MVTIERYPELKATDAFRDFQAQYEGMENRIEVERRKYNDVARNFNTRIKRFPGNPGGMFGFEEKGYFEAEEGTTRRPTSPSSEQRPHRRPVPGHQRTCAGPRGHRGRGAPHLGRTARAPGGPHREDVLDHAAYVFEELGMHCTRDRNGVLVYVAADRQVAVLGDSGINEQVPGRLLDRRGGPAEAALRGRAPCGRTGGGGAPDRRKLVVLLPPCGKTTPTNWSNEVSIGRR